MPTTTPKPTVPTSAPPGLEHKTTAPPRGGVIGNCACHADELPEVKGLKGQGLIYC